VGRVAYHDFEGVTVHPDEQPRLLASIGDKNLVILRHHGLLALGPTIEKAFYALWTLQRACDVQCQVDSLSGPSTPLSDAIKQKTRADNALFDTGGRAGRMMFDAMVRRVAAVDP